MEFKHNPLCFLLMILTLSGASLLFGVLVLAYCCDGGRCSCSNLFRSYPFTTVPVFSGVDAEAVGDSVYLVVSAYNVRIRVDADGMLFITLDIGHTLGALTGMCGDFDGDMAGASICPT